MQASPHCHVHKISLKNSICLKISWITVLKHCLEYLNDLEICLMKIEANLQNI
jgi:hypothetical protein